MNAERKRVVIVGGGISGLAAAYRLQSAARQRALPLDITLLESDQRLGGKIRTLRESGFVAEGGPDAFLASKPQALQLCRQLGLDRELMGVNENQRRTFIYSRGRLHDLPEGLTSLVPGRLSPLLRSSLITPAGKARLLLDFVRPAAPANGDESLAHFMGRRLGREAFERLIEPLMGGIYAGDAQQLSLQATFPQLRQLELAHGSLMRGVMRSSASNNRQRSTSQPSEKVWTGFVSLRGGMQELTGTLTAQLDIAWRTGATVESIVQRAGRWSVMLANETREADAVIIATPAYATAHLLRDVDPSLAGAHAAITHVSTATISLAYRRTDLPHPLNGFGFIVPSAERRALLACTWSSNKFAERAPADMLLLRCFVGRAGREGDLEHDDDDLLALVRAELRTILQIHATPLWSAIVRWPQGMPQYNLGHVERVAQIESRVQQHPGLFLAGAAYHGVGIPDCIRSANTAADAALTYLYR